MVDVVGPKSEARARAEALAVEHIGRGDAVGWFDELYRQAAGDEAMIPWADMVPNPRLVRWLKDNPGTGASKALVVGCGLGDDAETLSAAGYEVTAFDVSQTSVDWCRRRFPDSKVDYEVADLLAAPPRYQKRFDLVAEIYTVQSLPVDVRFDALDALSSMLAWGGRLLVITRGRDDDAAATGPPWAMSYGELEQLHYAKLRLDRFEDFFDDEEPPKRRFVAVYRRPVPLIAPIEERPIDVIEAPPDSG